MGLISRVSSRTYRNLKNPTKKTMPLAVDLLHPSLACEKAKHKKKRLVQAPNSFFMDVKCPNCLKIRTIFSHAQSVVVCQGCASIMSQPTGGKARLTSGAASERSRTSKKTTTFSHSQFDQI